MLITFSVFLISCVTVRGKSYASIFEIETIHRKWSIKHELIKCPSEITGLRLFEIPLQIDAQHQTGIW